MTLEELSIQLTADIVPFAAAMEAVSRLLLDVGQAAEGLENGCAAAGVRAAEGLQYGLLSRRDAVAEAARALADAATLALRDALSIHSPSRVTYEFGAYFDEGFLWGMADGVERVEREARRLSQSAVKALETPELETPVLPAFAPAPAAAGPEAVNDALSRLQLTIPLEIDGYRLGVAALDGIRQVTQSSGQTELTL